MYREIKGLAKHEEKREVELKVGNIDVRNIITNLRFKLMFKRIPLRFVEMVFF